MSKHRNNHYIPRWAGHVYPLVNLAMLGAAVLTALLVAAANGPVYANLRPAATTDPVVVYAHGFVASAGCPNARITDPSLDTVLAANGYTGPQVGLNWLCGDKGGLDVKPFGRIPTANYNATAHIADIAYAVAWALYHTYSEQGVHINYVGHSMGGLFMRYALGHVGTDPAFPPYLLVDHVVSVSSPFKGWDKNPGLMGVTCGSYTQCQEMKPGSAFTTELTAMPKPATRWTCIGGSPKDQVSTIASSCGLPADTSVDYYDSSVVNYEHSAYMTDTSETEDVTAKINGVVTTGVGHSLRMAWKGLVAP